MEETPRSNRLHVAFFGRTNSGKSTLLNTLAGQAASIVSPVSGTTTDPVYRPMELLPIGPVVLIDTAGLDDRSDLGGLRTAKTGKPTWPCWWFPPGPRTFPRRSGTWPS